MKKRMRLCVGCAVVMAVGGALAQVNVNWLAPVDGLYTDGTKWNGGAVPSFGDKGRFAENGTYTITFPQDFTDDVSMTEVNISNGKVTFDTRGGSWIKPTGTHLLTDHTFRIMNGGHSFNLEGTDGAGGNNRLQFGLIDAVLSAEATPDTIHTTLESGMLNIYDATGVNDSGVRLVFGHVNNRSNYATWKEGSTSRIRQVDFRGAGPENIFFYEGGDHTVFGNFTMMCWDVGDRTGQVLVTGGKLDVRGQLNVGARTNAMGYVLVDGGELHVHQLRVALEQRTARGMLVVSNGVLNVRDEVQVSDQQNTLGRVLIEGGDVTMAKSLALARYSDSRAEVEMTSGSLTVTSNVSVATAVGSEASFVLQGGNILVFGSSSIGDRGIGTAEMSGGRWETRGNVVVGQNGNAVGRFTVSGGSLVTPNSVFVGTDVDSDGEFYVTGGTHLMRELNVARNNCRGYAEFSGGEVTASNGIQVGENAGATNSVFVVSGGRHTVNSELGLAVGRAGLGYIEISGGEMDCYGYVRLGYGTANYDGYAADKTNRISTLRMSGGVLRVLNGYPVNTADGASNSGRVILDGGTLVARSVRGWTGSACRPTPGNGHSELVADGGRVVTLAEVNNERFMETFDLALLGDSGLTVDTDGRPARINQAFDPKPDTRGRLIKAGSGTLYLNGVSTIGDLVVEGGVLVVQAANVFSGDLVVTNSATFSLLESGGLTLKSLTLGDASSVGRLMMNNSDTVVITEVGGLKPITAWVFLSDSSANGTYTLFSCAGEVTLQDIEGLELGNGVTTKDYVWSVAYDSGKDETDVVLTVSNRAMVSPITWTGATDSLWSDLANWLNGPPVKGENALFPDVAARKNVTVTTDAVTGEMAFEAEAGYTLSGEPLLLDNGNREGRVTVTQGANQISAPLILKRSSTFDISEGTALAVDTLKGDGTLIKEGTGFAMLNGSDEFKGGFTVQEGTLALTSPEAFGEPSLDSGRWTLAGGTLRYDSADAVSVVNNSIAINMGTFGASDGAAVVDVVDNELVLNGNPVAAKGALIKRGVGTLTFNVSGLGSNLSAGNGKAGNNAQQPSYLVEFAENGQAPLGGYSGFNVAEGKVRLTSANASSTLDIRNSASIGLQTLQGTADPVLEIDHCRVTQGGGGFHFYIGGRTPVGSPVTNPTLRVVNNGYLWTDTLQLGAEATGPVNPNLFLDAAQVWVNYLLGVRQPQGGTTSITLTNKAELLLSGAGFQAERSIRFEADDSLLRLNSGSVNFTSSSQGTFTLRNGSRLRYPRFSVMDNAQMLFTFDNAILEPSANDITFAFRGDNTLKTVELLNQGVTFDVASGITHTLGRNMTGNGAFRKAGLGTLIFAGLMQEADVGQGVLEYTSLGAPIDDYTGGTWVDAGTLVVSNATIRTDRRITVAQGATLDLSDTSAVGTLAGIGTIVDGALTQGTLAPGMTDGETGSLTLDGTTLTGVTFACDVVQDIDKSVLASDKLLNVGTASNVTVDFGRTSVDPLLTPCSIVIGTYDIANPEPDVSTWKVKGVGTSGTIGRVEAADGVITATIRFGGFILLIR